MGLLCLVVENLSHIALLGLILLGSNPSQIDAIQVLSVTGVSRRVGFQRQSPARHIHINPFSSLSQNRISSISSYGNPQIPPVSHVRRDVSLVNIARETENDVDGVSFDSGTINRYINEMDEEYLDDDTGDDGEDEQPNEPICRVVAASDSKIPPLSAYSALSPASKTLVQKLELLYAAQSQKKLREFTYFPYQDGSQVDDVESKDQQLVSTLKQSLEDGGFKLMDQRDFDLCSALNAGYLLRLSLLPDLKDLDPTIGQQFYPELYEHSGDTKAKTPDKSPKNNLLFDGRVLVYRRGYSQEVTTGRLLLPKLDYLQASLVQRSSASLTRKFGVIEQKLEDAVAELVGSIYNTLRRWWLQLLMLVQTTAIDILKSSGILEYQLVGKLISSNKFFSTDFPGMIEQCHLSTTVEMATPDNEFQVRGNRIFRLGRYGVGERYSTFNVIANSLDLSDALSPFSLCEVGSNDTTSIEQDMYEGIDAGKLKCQYDEIYGSSESSVGSQPSAVRLLERVSIQNTVNFFSEYGRRDLIKNYFKKSTLKEPAYEEVVVIWRPHKRKKLLKKQLSRITTFPKWLYGTARIFDIEHKLPKRVDEHSSDSIDDVPSPIEIRAFNDVPMANLPAVLPKTKLIFRPADALVFDLVSIVSFIALGASLKFDNPRLDLLAVVSLSVFAVR